MAKMCKTQKISYLCAAISQPNYLLDSLKRSFCNTKSRVTLIIRQQNKTNINYQDTLRIWSWYNRKCYLYCSSYVGIRHNYHIHRIRIARRTVGKHETIKLYFSSWFTNLQLMDSIWTYFDQGTNKASSSGS